MVFAPLLIMVLPIILIIILIVYAKNVISRMEQRSEKRLQIDRQNSEIHQQQMKVLDELNLQISNVEKLLKQVE